MKYIKSIVTFSLFIIFLSGCSATGSNFSTVSSAPSDKASVYFYRPKAFSGGGVSVALVDNGKNFASLQNGQFIQKLFNPGQHKFHTDTAAIDKEVNLDLKAGETYFVRTGIRMGMWVGTWYLTRVFPQEALAELKICCKTGS